MFNKVVNRTFHEDGTKPQNGEIFVFGSNLGGIHGAGAALAARKYYGALQGVAEGIMGGSYALPTVNYAPGAGLSKMSLEDIASHVMKFVAYANANPNKRFFVTRVGCVRAGYEDADIAPMFRDAHNCDFAQSWKQYLEQ